MYYNVHFQLYVLDVLLILDRGQNYFFTSFKFVDIKNNDIVIST